ncbi:MAG: NAD(P)/FAD-dependent oxidoreductase [Lachnospiraceae bacterium]|nr:NAD(P)/FAD-dependent oxidoreductase [Lachnospiraceae bacterium]
MKTVIIGGGPAGMMAAVSAADSGDNVILLEKNEKLGKKLFITGKGRCNVTNACEREVFFEHVISNPKFLYSAYSALDSKALMDFIEENKTPLKIERGNRVFPVSDHSYDIIDALKRALQAGDVEIRLNTEAGGILTGETEAETGKKVITGVRLKNGEMIKADKVILATGGLSYPSTGSTGDGHKFAEESGHKMTACRPALVPFETKEEWVKSLQGLSLKNVKLSLVNGGKTIYGEQGEMLFTHFGISGPLVLSASSIYAGIKEYKDPHVLIDLKPALTEEETDRRLIRELQEGNRKELKNILNEIYPLKLAGIICDIAGIDQYRRCNEVSAKERKALLDVTKRLRISIRGCRDFNEAIITHGGVSVKEIQPKTMESRIVSGLYFAGEIMDVDAFTGGFNLQIAFSTGYLAGKHIY